MRLFFCFILLYCNLMLGQESGLSAQADAEKEICELESKAHMENAPAEKVPERARALPKEILSVTPPKGWDCVSDPEQLPQKVSVIYIGSGKSQFTPSINLASEETSLSPEEYMALAKSYHQGQGETRCKSLGMIDTKAGKARLLQIDRPTQWGNVRFIQAVIVRNNNAYVITATCLQEEFASLSSQMFKSIQSFTINSR